MGFGFVGVFLGGLFKVSSGFWGLCWVWVLSGQVWVFNGCFVGLGCFRGRIGCSTVASTVFWDLGFMWVLGGMGSLLFLGSGFVRTLLYIVCIRRGTLRFFIKVAFLIIKKKYKQMQI
jgi:hypothetical protein